jgi:class 3 adenylate cyclase
VVDAPAPIGDSQRKTVFPIGTATFLFTDIEGSSRLWERHQQAMLFALARHDTLGAPPLYGG